MLPVVVRSFLRLSLLAALVAAAPALAGCSYTSHQGALTNGEASQLYFSGAGASSAFAAAGLPGDILAVGYAATVVVERYGPGDVPCTGLGLNKNDVSSGGLHIQGGDLGNTEHCASRPADGVTLVSASCIDDTCSVVADTSKPSAVTLTVTGAHAGTSHLAVSLKSAVDGKTYADTIVMRFAAPARIKLGTEPRFVVAMNGPVLPGVEIERPRAWVVDADDEKLEIADGALAAVTEGDAYAETPEFGWLKSQHAGHTVVRWSYPGLADRSIDLEVVDPSEAHALFVYAPLPSVPSGTAASAIEEDPADVPPEGEPATGRITSIDLVQYDFGTFPLRVKLADGRFALAAVEDPVLTPAVLGTVMFGGLDPSTVDVEANGVVGEGTVTLRAAPGATATLVVKVTARPAR